MPYIYYLITIFMFCSYTLVKETKNIFSFRHRRRKESEIFFSFEHGTEFFGQEGSFQRDPFSFQKRPLDYKRGRNRTVRADYREEMKHKEVGEKTYKIGRIAEITLLFEY